MNECVERTIRTILFLIRPTGISRSSYTRTFRIEELEFGKGIIMFTKEVCYLEGDESFFSIIDSDRF